MTPLDFVAFGTLATGALLLWVQVTSADADMRREQQEREKRHAEKFGVYL